MHKPDTFLREMHIFKGGIFCANICTYIVQYSEYIVQYYSYNLFSHSAVGREMSMIRSSYKSRVGSPKVFLNKDDFLRIKV